MLDFDEIWERLSVGDESTGIEVKRGSDVGKSTLETISAFSNEPNNGGGYFVFGVVKNDELLFPEYKITGVDDLDKVQTTMATVCRDSMQPPVRPTIWTETREGKTVVIAHIAEAQPHEKPIFIKSKGISNGSYRRIGSTDQKCTDEDLAVLIQNRGHKSFDQTILPDTSIEDVEAKAIAEYRRLRKEVNPAAAELELSDEELLYSLGATDKKDEKLCLTVAGMLLFGKSSSLRRHFPMTRIDYIRVPGREGLPDDRVDLEIRESLLLVIPRLIGQIVDDLPKSFSFVENDPVRKDAPIIPFRALREAVVNAIMHRDYRADRPTQVIRYSNRLEIHNAGYSLVSEDKFGEPLATQSRNPRIADVLHDLNLAETKGTGIKTIRKLMDEANLTLPLFKSDRPKDAFTATLFSIHFLGKEEIEWLTNFKDCNLKDEEVRALVFLRQVGFIDNSLFRSLAKGMDTLEASRSLQRLRNLELIISQNKGANTYYVPGRRMLEAEGQTLNEGSIPHSLPHSLSHNLSHSDVPVLPAYLTELVEQLGLRASHDELRYAIVKLCGWRSLHITELAAILNRNKRHIRERHLNPLIKRGDLVHTIPENPTHPDQAYKTPKKSKDRSN